MNDLTNLCFTVIFHLFILFKDEGVLNPIQYYTINGTKLHSMLQNHCTLISVKRSNLS